MKRLLNLLLLGSVIAVGSAQAENSRITQSEFKDYLRYESSSCSLEESWANFVVRKLKVADAVAKGWDTLPSFIQLCKSIQGEALKAYLFEKYRDRLGTLQQPCSYLLEQWFVALPQNSGKVEERMAVYRMDSCLAALNNHDEKGIPAKIRHSVGWYSEDVLLNEFKDILPLLSVNELSKPFFSPVGLHVIKIVCRNNSTPKISPDEVYASYGDILSSSEKPYGEDVVVRSRFLGIRDSLLATYWDMDNQEKMNDLLCDEIDLKDFFQSHRHLYAWEFPHFKGAVIHCKNKKMASRIKKYLKKYDFWDWERALAEFIKQYPDAQVQMEYGLFQIGINQYVDKLAFKCGSLPVQQDERYVFIYGKRLDKGPDSYQDVYTQVLSDYKKELYAREIQRLNQCFPLDFDAEILKTVNCCGSN